MYSYYFILRFSILLSVGQLAFATNLGQWGPLIEFPLVPVAAALLHDTGELLLWSANKEDTYVTGQSRQTHTVIYDPAKASVNHMIITNTNHDMFCPGTSADFNGRLVVTGGASAAKTSIYDVAKKGWIPASDMTIPRGYHASVTVSDGRIFTIGGSWSGKSGGQDGEIYDPVQNRWSPLPGCAVAPMLTADNGGIFRQDNHAWLFAWKNGFVFQAGPSRAMNWYGTAGTGSQISAGFRASDSDAMTGDAVMYDAVAGKILTVGGSPHYEKSHATSNANVITLSNPGSYPNVKAINPMWFPRAFANGVVLPDGKVFITGGQTYAVPYSDADAVLTPELWDPKTTQFFKMAPNQTPRNYHSVGLLMPDATVFSGGGGLCGNTCATNHFNGQFYSPPYLFLSDGVTRAPRPVIASLASSTVRIGASITVTMQGPAASFALIRMGTTTHTVNTDQRRIPLSAATVQGLTYTISVPGDAGVAVPGYWMLFAMDGNGVPSLARTVLVTL